MEQKLFDFGNELVLLMDKHGIADYSKIPNDILSRYICENIDSIRIMNRRLTKYYERQLEESSI